jgi:hypothetical protein
VKNVRVSLSADREDLYEPLMRGACMITQVEAAYRLVFQVEELWAWLLRHGYVELVSGQDFDHLEVDLAAAAAYDHEIGAPGFRAERPELSESARAVLVLAASLAGKTAARLRDLLYELDETVMRLVVEAMMYAGGFMDGSADVWGNEEPGDVRGLGPNSRANEDRWDM